MKNLKKAYKIVIYMVNGDDDLVRVPWRTFQTMEEAQKEVDKMIKTPDQMIDIEPTIKLNDLTNC